MSTLGYSPHTRLSYLAYLLDAQRILGDRGQLVSKPDEYMTTEYRVNSVVHAGFAVYYAHNYDALDLTGVFSKWGGQLANIMQVVEHIAKRECLHCIRLDCFEQVRPVWERHGFREYKRDEFNPDLAPQGWPKSLGYPDVVYMEKHL